MNPSRQSIPEAAAYKILAVVPEDLHKVARLLMDAEMAAKDQERGAHLEALTKAIRRTPDHRPAADEPLTRRGVLAAAYTEGRRCFIAPDDRHDPPRPERKAVHAGLHKTITAIPL